LLLALPSDHVIEDVATLHAALAPASRAAEAGAIVTFGLPPAEPSSAYGYIVRGAPHAGAPGVFAIERFVEKPNASEAEALIKTGACSWNGGMFLFRAEAFLREAELTAPDVTAPVRELVAAAPRDGEVLHLSEAYAAVPDISVDHAVMERSRRVAVITADIGWSDLGNWTAVWEGSPRDARDQALVGDVVTTNASRNLVRTDGPPVVLSGVSGLAVVVENGVVLVTALDDPKGAGAAAAALRELGRDELL
jgi:mannose-1-phosphate guanylyltransferase/mannose-6-phosphate isomerase